MAAQAARSLLSELFEAIHVPVRRAGISTRPRDSASPTRSRPSSTSSPCARSCCVDGEPVELEPLTPGGGRSDFGDPVGYGSDDPHAALRASNFPTVSFGCRESSFRLSLRVSLFSTACFELVNASRCLGARVVAATEAVPPSSKDRVRPPHRGFLLGAVSRCASPGRYETGRGLGTRRRRGVHGRTRGRGGAPTGARPNRRHRGLLPEACCRTPTIPSPSSSGAAAT